MQVRVSWSGHVVRRAFYDVMSGLQPTWPDDNAERVLRADDRTIQHVINARSACELYTQRLVDVIESKVSIVVVFVVMATVVRRQLCLVRTVSSMSVD